MKAVLMSIHPNWCEKIFNGEKTIEVRKTAPKLETPFKVYVYQTKHKGDKSIVNDVPNGVYGGGKVIGSFVCNRVEKFSVGSLHCDDIEQLACLTYSELINYFYKPEELDGKTVKWGFGWHITELKLFDKPRELSEFSKFGFKDAGGCCVNYKCHNCINNGWFQPPECKIDGCQITRPPQSWCYVEVNK